VRSLIYIFYNSIYKPILKLYLKTDSNIKFDGFKLKVFKEVFHPKLFFSTKYFYSFLDSKSFKGLKFLEIGCGSGILSLLAFRKEAKVTALDVDLKAVENTKLNFRKNFSNASDVLIVQSDLFEELAPQQFDIIVINPPYYFKKIESDYHYAWYCGENGEYFERLFSGISFYMHSNTHVYMVLEENCEIERIRSIALKNNIVFELADERLIKWEKNFIFILKQVGKN
jgi:release factor glutamine methyltransferase